MSEPNFFQSRGQKVKGLFIRGPLPLDFLAECFKLGPNATKMGLAFLYLRERKRSDTVKLTGDVKRLFLISPWTVSQKLKVMEEKGLIQLQEIRRGVAPVVNLLLDQYYEPTADANTSK